PARAAGDDPRGRAAGSAPDPGAPTAGAAGVGRPGGLPGRSVVGGGGGGRAGGGGGGEPGLRALHLGLDRAAEGGADLARRAAELPALGGAGAGAGGGRRPL